MYRGSLSRPGAVYRPVKVAPKAHLVSLWAQLPLTGFYHQCKEKSFICIKKVYFHLCLIVVVKDYLLSVSSYIA
jgi:hypothetical protein